MKRVFLSLPMAGRTNEEIEKQIEEMKRWILKSKFFGDEAVIFVHNHDYRAYGYRIVDDYEEHGITHRGVPAECRRESLLYLGYAIGQMAYVDYVFFGNGWTKARGCCAERDVALSYDIPVADCSSLAHLKKIKCPECHGEGKFYWPNGETKICQSCAGVGYLERVKKEEPEKEVTNNDISNMLQRIHHENCIIFSALASMAQIDDDKIDLVVDDWVEKFKKAKGE